MRKGGEDNNENQEQDQFQQQQFNMTISSSREGISQRDYLHKMATETREELQITDYQFHPIRPAQKTRNSQDFQEYSPPMEPAHGHSHETGYMVLRANTCKNQLRKWQERKIKHEYSMIEKEILKQILQDEYTLEQKQFWIQRDKQKSPSPICQKHYPHFQSQQQHDYSQKHTMSSLSPVSNKGTLPQFNATVLSFGNDSRQKFPRAHSLQSKVVSSSQSIKKNAQTIEYEQNKSSQRFKERDIRNGQQSQGKGSSQTESRLKQQINSSQEHSKSRIQNNPLSQSYYVESNEFSSPYRRISSKESQHGYQMQRASSKEMKQENLNTITPREIREDFVFQNPHSKLIIMKTFNQMNKQQEPRVRSPKVFENTQPFHKNISFQSKILEFNKASPIKTTISQTKQGSCYRFCEPLPITDPASVQKQAKKVVQERRRNYCLNQHFRVKIDKLISDEEFSERERKSNLSNLVRRKVHNNNTLSTNLKLQSSFIATNDQLTSPSPISQSLPI